MRRKGGDQMLSALTRYGSIIFAAIAGGLIVAMFTGGDDHTEANGTGHAPLPGSAFAAAAIPGSSRRRPAWRISPRCRRPNVSASAAMSNRRGW